MDLDFTKMEGLGNDFVVVDGPIDLDPTQISRLCDRRRGIGADGVLIVTPVSSAEVSMAYFNADGSRAEMCGNGIRCVARYAYDRGLVDEEPFRVATDAGPYEVDIRNGDQVRTYLAESAVADELIVAGITLRRVSMGNPHAVAFVDELDTAPVTSKGPLIETDDEFPNRTNVEFVRVDASNRISVRTWERGVGETQACGTGAGAAVVAAHAAGLVADQVTVGLLGGDLHIELNGSDVWQEGPASYSFSGRTSLLEA